jgi:hypothetical protein
VGSIWMFYKAFIEEDCRFYTPLMVEMCEILEDSSAFLLFFIDLDFDFDCYNLYSSIL